MTWEPEHGGGLTADASDKLTRFVDVCNAFRGSLPIDGGIEAAYRRELAAADDPVALRAEVEARLNAVRSPFRTAERFSIEEIVDPHDTRPILCDWAARAHELIALDAVHGPVARGTRP